MSGPSLAYGSSRARHDEKNISALQLTRTFLSGCNIFNDLVPQNGAATPTFHCLNSGARWTYTDSAPGHCIPTRQQNGVRRFACSLP